MTSFHPADGRARSEGVTTRTGEEPHGWPKEELTEVLAASPPASAPGDDATLRSAWRRRQEGCRSSRRPPPAAELPPSRMPLVMDDLVSHETPAFVLWLLSKGIMPSDTPLGGSWLNMVESPQRILERLAVEGRRPGETLAWFEVVAGHRGRSPTPFAWDGRRAVRRRRGRRRLGGSGASVSG